MQHIRDGCAVSFLCNASAKQRALMTFRLAGILTFRFLPNRKKRRRSVLLATADISHAGCRHSGGFFDIGQGKRRIFTFQHRKATGKTIFFNKMIHFCIIISFTDKIV